jgi:N-acetylglucosaminyldiphosphoundecaprenol N-acetyl-beta-D-mannosaminyltransferase
LELALSDQEFSDALLNTNFILPDGYGMILASKLTGRIREWVTGSLFFSELSRTSNTEGGYRYFFLGSTEENLLLLKTKFQADFPNIIVSGTYSPPFRTEFSAEERGKAKGAGHRAKGARC